MLLSSMGASLFHKAYVPCMYCFVSLAFPESEFSGTATVTYSFHHRGLIVTWPSFSDVSGHGGYVIGWLKCGDGAWCRVV